ncbi:hypothetical protein ACR6HW_04030 [Fusibacter sp. JL298sf-3]
MSKDIQKATKMLFDERENFIIIGLTGRTGSGCSTVASLLGNSFAELSSPKPKEAQFENNEERKYKIVYEYAKSHWSEFTVIKMKSIITSFIVRNEYDEFVSFFNNIEVDGTKIINMQGLLKEVESKIKEKYEEVCDIRRDLKPIFDSEGDDALANDIIYDYYFYQMSELSDIIQGVLKSYKVTIENHPDANLYTYYYQLIANNVRSSGFAFIDKFDSASIFKLPQRTNLMIKILRRRNLVEKERVLVVIDALRNPFEISFFKDRYSAFYLMSVNTDPKNRVDRLINLGFNIHQIRNLDEKEYPKRLTGTKQFSSQNIQKCIELSDIYIYNPSIGTKNYIKVKKQLIRYVTLIMHPGLITPTAEERCMQIAFNAKVNAGCLSRQVGAIVTDDNYSVKSIGWNSSPEGQVPCNLRNLFSTETKDDSEAFSEYEINDSDYSEFVEGVLNEKKTHTDDLNGRLYPYCFKDMYNEFKDKENQVHTRALHAEENAFLQISKNGGMPLKNGFLFTTASPCELCSKKAYQIGIRKIYYVDPYPGISQDHILNCGKNRPEMILFHGAIGRAYTQLYTLVLPYKDELEMLVSEI